MFTRENLSWEEKLENVFPSFDLDGDGLLNRDEFFSLIQTLAGKYMEEHEIRELVDYALRTRPNGLTFDEFTRLIPRNPEENEMSAAHVAHLEAFHRQREKELQGHS